MKSAMPFHGVSAPDLRRVCREVFAGCRFPSAVAWRGAVLAFWRGARCREERHAAIELSGLGPSLPSKEFFLRKAIGWALRQYAWTDPAEVRRYVRENEGRLSPLSRREALKNVGASLPR